MLTQPRELAVLMQTKLTLVVATAAGHDPVKASGLLLAYLPMICRRVTADAPQLWAISATDRNNEAPWERLRKAAEHRNTTPQRLYARHKLLRRDLIVPLDKLLS
jgi:hypothetical protein